MFNKLATYFILIFGLLIVFINSCSKGPAPSPTPVDPCASKTIVVGGTNTLTSNATATDGTISATASGSTSAFTFSKDGTTFQASGNFTGLAVGSYTITVKDADGCKGTKSFSITSTPCPTITITATITPASNPAATNGAINSSASGGLSPYTFSKDAGVTFQASGAFTSLAVGGYTIIAKDANGCTGTANFSVTAASCPTITLTATPSAASGPSTTNGSIAVGASGGVAPYTFSKDGGTTFVVTSNFTSLSPGNYNVIAKDANGCTSTTSVVVVGTACPTITLSSAVVPTDKCPTNAATGIVTLTASGSTGFTYSKDNVTFQASNIFNNLAAGNYTVTAKDANGCTKTTTATVGVTTAGTLFTNVKLVLAANCALSGCHAGPTPQNGLDFTLDCTIVEQGPRIKARAVDANPSIMPPTGSISSTEKQKIIDWINAGGNYNN